MKRFFSQKDVKLIILIFILSRIIFRLFHVEFGYDALYRYWQYLDVETLRHNLLEGVWYDHAQPPLFNLFLGLILKISGGSSFFVFSLIFKLITLVNTLLLLAILKRVIQHPVIPVALSLFYLLSPAAVVFENELFYTTFISMLFLISCNYMQLIKKTITWKKAAGIFLPLVMICLTRSMYHLVWLLVICMFILFSHKRETGFRKLLFLSVCSLVLIAGWYVKNYMIFGQFSTSSWIGMNLARNVFHDAELKDSTRIETIPPFSPVSAYRSFLSSDNEKKYAGLNDRDLLQEMKNDTCINERHVAYLEISKKYLEASKHHIRSHPFSYLKNIAQSGISFFAPATRYTLTESQARKIKYYDLVYSFNISHLAKGKQQRRIALSISALPKMLMYGFTLFWLLKNWRRNKMISLLNLFILLVLAYVFTVSSLLEHYENMRFRFEVEPLFFILFAQALAALIEKRKEKIQ